MRHSESWKYVSISFYFEFYFKNCMQNYSTMSREHSGKKLLVITEDILHKSHFKFRISEPCGLQNCCLTRIKLSAFLTMFMLNFVTVTFPVFLKFLLDTCPFLGPLIPLFQTSGDVSSGFQSQSGFCLIRTLQRHM